MGKTIFFLSITVLFFLSVNCNKNKLIPDDEIPQWLKERIAEDEAVIDTAPKLMTNYGAWIRYKFEEDYYFEYDNALSSACCYMLNFEGEYYNYFDESFETYQDDKCCKKYVWKAPKY
ncbi:MAG: hypothetical protein K8R54_04270 [Bacteroidales bacterium]|nr:hypothetical protein [Bacteroidales bacterium]